MQRRRSVKLSFPYKAIAKHLPCLVVYYMLKSFFGHICLLEIDQAFRVSLFSRLIKIPETCTSAVSLHTLSLVTICPVFGLGI